jgi:hypothetical protein
MIIHLLFVCSFGIKPPEDYLKKIETCRIINGSYVKAYCQYFCVCWQYRVTDTTKKQAASSTRADDPPTRTLPYIKL